MAERPVPSCCRHEPAYPDHETVECLFSAPHLVLHEPSERCQETYPHRMVDCGEFDD